ncbi:putative ribonuclease T(2) [Helianthus anomalus]
MYPSGGIIAAKPAIENAFDTTLQLVYLKGALEEIRLSSFFRDCVAASDCSEYVSLPAFASLDATKPAGRLISGAESSWIICVIDVFHNLPYLSVGVLFYSCRIPLSLIKKSKEMVTVPPFMYI